MSEVLATVPPIDASVPVGIASTPREAEHRENLAYRADQVRVAIIDDEPINIDLLELYLADSGYQQFQPITDSREAIDRLRSEPPDVVLLDLMMPHVSGFDILEIMRSDPHLKLLPVIILTAASNPESKLRALELGVSDFLSKPVDPSELLLRLRNTLASKALQDHLADYSAKLERDIAKRTAELEASRQEAIHCLARAAEYRDDDTGKHVVRVGRYVAILAAQLGFSRTRIALLEQASQLHDVGKIGIPDAVLLKRGKLDSAEFDMIKEHCKFGRKIIEPMSDTEWSELRTRTNAGQDITSIGSSPIMRLAAIIAETHHEKWDGSGYPHGLAGEDIPIEGRITAVADVFDALSSSRPYKHAFPLQECIQIMEDGRGKHFDPRVLTALFDSLETILRVQAEFAD